MAEPSQYPLKPGEVLAGKYRVDRILGTGAMGVVVAAHHEQLDEEVAIKFMLPEALENPQAVARFTREARAAVKIKSEHVVRVMDVGTLDNGVPFMVMEYLRGKDLADWLAEHGTLPIGLAVDFVLQAAVAVAEAHALGIVHRDLKPSNLFIMERPDGGHLVKVLDFGISKMAGKLSGSDMTHTSVIMGTPFYMSPEQLKSSRDADARSDIWSLGVILYELVAGDPPFEADTMPELVHRTISEPPPPLRTARPDAPVELEKVILKCLEKNPSDRFGDVTAFAAALAPFGPERSRRSLERISEFSKILSVPAESFAGAATLQSERGSDGLMKGAEGRTVVSWSHTEPRSRSKTIIGVAAAGIALATVAWLALRDSSTTAETGATTAAPAPLSGGSPTGAEETEAEPPPAPTLEASSTPAESALPAAESSISSASKRPPATVAKPPNRTKKPASARPAKAPKAPAKTVPPASASTTPSKQAPGVEALIDERL